MKKINKLTHINSQIGIITIEVINKLIIQCKIPYDEAAILFKKSTTYQKLQNISTEFYQKSPTEILKIYYQEQIINLESDLSNNLSINEIMTIFKKRPIEEVIYQNNFLKKENHTKNKRKIKTPKITSL